MNTNTLPNLKTALTAAVNENTAATESGVAKWDDALEFAYQAMPVAAALMQSAEFLADALPGIKAYAASLDNENYRSMWNNQIAKYEATLAILGLAEPVLLNNETNSQPPAEDTPYEIVHDERIDKGRSQLSNIPEPDRFNYQLLARLQMDCEYYLGHGNRVKKHLWAGDEAEQIQKMKEVYNALPEKPEWISLETIAKYEAAMIQTSA